MRRSRLLWRLTSGIAVLALAGGGQAGSTGSPGLTGTWDCCGAGGAAAQIFVITGSSGIAKLPGGRIFATIRASGGGGTVRIVTTYNDFAPGYVAVFVGKLSADGNTMSGTWTSNRSQAGTWTATRERLAISGEVKTVKCGAVSCAPAPLAGVRVGANGSGGSASDTTGTDGSYSIKVANKGGYRVTPTLAGEEFLPSWREVTIADKAVAGIDFRACASRKLSNARELSSARARGAAVRTGLTYKGTTRAECPEQTFVMRYVESRGRVQLESWSFTPICTSVSGQRYAAPRITIRGDRGDSAAPDAKTGAFFIALKSPDAQGHLAGRLLADKSQIILSGARFERAPSAQPPSATCPAVVVRSPLALTR